MAAPMIAKELQQSFRSALERGEAAPPRVPHPRAPAARAHPTTRASREVLKACGADLGRLQQRLEGFLEETVEQLPRGRTTRSRSRRSGVERVLQRAAIHALSADQKTIDGGDVLVAIFREEESYARLPAPGGGRHPARPPELHLPRHRPKEGERGRRARAAVGDAGGRGGRGRRPQKNPLKAYTTNLNDEAKAGRIDPLIGRERELERTMQVLCRRRKNNPLYVGEPGVGKTAIAEGLALAIHEKQGPRGARGRDASTRSTWARCSPARSSAASSRSGSRACIKALDAARRTRSSSSTRSTPSSARARPPAARWTRRTCSSRRSPRASCAASARPRTRSTRQLRARPRARAPLPEDRGRRALGRGHDRDPQGAAEPLRGAPRRHLRRGRDRGRRRALGEAHQRPVPARTRRST